MMSSKFANRRESQESTSSTVVVVRVRPLSGREVSEGHRSCCVVQDQVVTISKFGQPGQHLKSQLGQVHDYAFDYAFGAEATQAEVYRCTAHPLIPHILDGYNATVFAYGATGAGKTHTMMGIERNGSEPRSKALQHGSGIIPQALHEIFDLIEQRLAHYQAMRACGDGSESQWTVKVSYLEVYNEQIYDLLNPSTRTLQLREDPAQGIVHVAGLEEIEVREPGEVMELLRRGNLQRKTEPTAANQVSSRSHAVLQVTVKNVDVSPMSGSKSGPRRLVREGKLSLIDLAGSERASKTQNRGMRLHEGANINKSLLALANCINALATNFAHNGPATSASSLNGLVTPARPRRKPLQRVQYRDSKLTHLLKSSLEGTCRLVMIANISESHLSYEETQNTLKYANRAKNIKISPTATVMTAELSIQQRTLRLEEENKSLREKVAQLMEKLETAVSVAPGSIRKKRQPAALLMTPQSSKRHRENDNSAEQLGSALKRAKHAALFPLSDQDQNVPQETPVVQRAYQATKENEVYSWEKRLRQTPNRHRPFASPEGSASRQVALRQQEQELGSLRVRVSELEEGRQIMVSLIETLKEQLEASQNNNRELARELEQLKDMRQSSITAAVEEAVDEAEKSHKREMKRLLRSMQTVHQNTSSSTLALTGSEAEKKAVTDTESASSGNSVLNSSLLQPTPSYRLRLRARQSLGGLNIPSYHLSFPPTVGSSENDSSVANAQTHGGENTGLSDGVRKQKRRVSLIPRLPSAAIAATPSRVSPFGVGNDSRMSQRRTITTRSMTAVQEECESQDEDSSPELQSLQLYDRGDKLSSSPTLMRRGLREITNNRQRRQTMSVVRA